LFYPEYHLQRLAQGLLVLGFPDCRSSIENQLSGVLEELAQANVREAVVRVTVTRGGGPRGYAPPAACVPRTLIGVVDTDRSWKQLSRPAHLAVATIRLAAQPQLAGIKHLNRLEQVLAARERAEMAVDELLMLDQNAFAVSVISGNVFAVVAGDILTPTLQSCGVRGTRRQLLIDRWAPALGIQVAERNISAEQLEQAEELFFTNSLLGLCPVASLGSGRWSSNPVCEALHALYCGENS
jgi:4-amino-4-deoxychorismate lyase